jgi:hypothetical protein
MDPDRSKEYSVRKATEIPKVRVQNVMNPHRSKEHSVRKATEIPNVWILKYYGFLQIQGAFCKKG